MWTCSGIEVVPSVPRWLPCFVFNISSGVNSRAKQRSELLSLSADRPNGRTAVVTSQVFTVPSGVCVLCQTRSRCSIVFLLECWDQSPEDASSLLASWISNFRGTYVRPSRLSSIMNVSSISLGSTQFRRVRKIAKNNCCLCHVCPSVCMEQFGSQWTDFREICYLIIFRKVKFYWNLTRITATLHEDHYTFLFTYRSFLLRMRNVADKSCREYENTFMFSNLFTSQILSLMRLCVGGGDIVEPGRPQMTIWRMRIACWIPKATNTRSDCDNYCFSTLLSVTL
jgi:hypothetical protein